MRHAFMTAAMLTTACLILAPLAVGDPPDPRSGIERARAAGIYVDPRAEDAMARAPIGSCPNDPTRPGCGATTRVVHVDVDPVTGQYLEPGRRSTMTARQARAAYEAAAAPLCFFRHNYNSPWKAAGYAQGSAAHECWDPTVTRQELYGTLYKLYSGRWYQMASDSHGANESGVIRVHARYNCTANVKRSWNFGSNAYTKAAGTWYVTGSASSNNRLNCG
jgi:hypothetical protein